MSERRRLWLVLVALVVGASLVTLALPEATLRGPVSVNRQADGLRAAWRYAAARGWPAEVWRRPLAELDLHGAGVLVVAVPAPAPYRPGDVDALRRWLMVGGDVVVLLDAARPPASEGEVLAGLGVDRGAVSMASLGEGTEGDAWSLLRREVPLAGAGGWDPGLPILARMSRWIVRPEAGEALLAASEDGRVAVRLRHVQQGRVVVFDDGAMLANGWLGREGTGNLALFEEVLRRLHAERGLWLDEWHWGLREVVDAAAVGESRRALDLLLGHLLLIYAGVAWALGRRFGPVPAPTPPPRTSVDRDLRALGALHARAGHPDQVGALLLDGVRRTARPGSPGLAALPADFDGDDAALVALAQQVGDLQEEGRL